MSKYLLLMFVLLFSLAGVAQKKKKMTGYYLTKDGDTVNCTFLPRNWKKQPIEVRITINDKEQKITATNSKGFYLHETDTWYKSTKIEPALYEHQMQFANSHSTPEYDSAKPVFAKRIFKYDLSLWLYIDPVERNHFLLVQNDQYVEIYKHLYFTMGGYHNMAPLVTWYNQYMYELKTYMADCKELFPIIDVIELKETDLIKFFTLYKSCKEDKNK